MGEPIFSLWHPALYSSKIESENNGTLTTLYIEDTNHWNYKNPKKIDKFCNLVKYFLETHSSTELDFVIRFDASTTHTKISYQLSISDKSYKQRALGFSKQPEDRLKDALFSFDKTLENLKNIITNHQNSDSEFTTFYTCDEELRRQKKTKNDSIIILDSLWEVNFLEELIKDNFNNLYMNYNYKDIQLAIPHVESLVLDQIKDLFGRDIIIKSMDIDKKIIRAKFKDAKEKYKVGTIKYPLKYQEYLSGKFGEEIKVDMNSRRKLFERLGNKPDSYCLLNILEDDVFETDTEPLLQFDF